MKMPIICLEFNCDNNLSQYTDSMLFDSGTEIASGKFGYNGKILDIYLDVSGEVAVTYKGETYHTPSEFPEELIEKIKEHPNWWEGYAPSGEGNDNEEGDVYVYLNNWFEYIYGEEVLYDGTVYENDLSKATKEEILEDMRYIAEQYFERKEV